MREEYAAENYKHVSALLQGTKRVRRIMEDIEKESKPHTLFLPSI